MPIDSLTPDYVDYLNKNMKEHRPETPTAKDAEAALQVISSSIMFGLDGAIVRLAVNYGGAVAVQDFTFNAVVVSELIDRLKVGGISSGWLDSKGDVKASQSKG